MINSYLLSGLLCRIRRPFPRSPLLIKALLESALSLVKLAIGCQKCRVKGTSQSPLLRVIRAPCFG